MTAHVHDRSVHGAGEADTDPRTGPAVPSIRPWWLLPGVAGAIVLAGLVLAGVVAASTVLYLGVFGGIMLVCMRGHGHGGHGGHDTAPGNTKDPQGQVTRIQAELSATEIERTDRPGGHGCH